MKLASYEKRSYVMNDKEDFVILDKIHKIEKLKLNNYDKEVIKLIRTQLKKNWRSPLIKYLDRLSIKYKK